MDTRINREIHVKVFLTFVIDDVKIIFFEIEGIFDVISDDPYRKLSVYVHTFYLKWVDESF